MWATAHTGHFSSRLSLISPFRLQALSRSTHAQLRPPNLQHITRDFEIARPTQTLATNDEAIHRSKIARKDPTIWRNL
jgi:hypothetical protein